MTNDWPEYVPKRPPSVTTPFLLEPGERLLKTCHARGLAPINPGGEVSTPAEGRLYLTTARLHWKRNWFNVPFIGPESFEVSLTDIQECTAEGWALVFQIRVPESRPMTEAPVRKVMPVKQRLWPPAFYFSKAAAEEWQKVINEVR